MLLVVLTSALGSEVFTGVVINPVFITGGGMYAPPCVKLICPNDAEVPPELQA